MLSSASAWLDRRRVRGRSAAKALSPRWRSRRETSVDQSWRVPMLRPPCAADRARDHDVDRLGGWIKGDMRLAASKLYQHLRDLGLERRLVLAIVGALTQHERLDHRPQRVWLESSGANRIGTFSVPRRSRSSSTVNSRSSCMWPQRYTMAVARVRAVSAGLARSQRQRSPSDRRYLI